MSADGATMISPRPHAREDARLAALHGLSLLDTDAEERFDRLVKLAAVILDVPIVLVSLVDRDRQWFKARVGLDATETSRDVSFCGHAIADDVSQLIVENAAEDDRFHDNPLVVGAPHIGFYAGQVVRDPTGLPMGTLCAIDRRPRRLDAAQREALGHLGALVQQELARVDEIELARRVAASEAAKSLIVDTMLEGVVLQGVDGSIIEWNRSAERVLGLSADELAGRVSTDPRWRAIHPDGSPWPGEDHPAMQALRTARPVVDALMGVHHPDGTRVWLRVNSQPVLADGVATHVLSVFADVTAEREELDRRRELEERLAQSEEAARISLDSLEQGVILADGAGNVYRMNPAARLILGYEADEISRLWKSPEWQTYDEHGDPLPPEQRPIATALATGRTVTGRIVGWVRSDGRRVLLRVSCHPDVADTGRMLVALSDITEERRVQRILDATFEAAPTGLALIEASGAIVRCNERFGDQALRSPEELVGVDVLSLVHPDDREAAATVAARVRGGTGGEIEHRVARVAGPEMWVKTHLGTIDDPDRPMAIAASFDVTTERRLLQELARFGHLFRRANDVIVVIDASGAILYGSESSRGLLGTGGPAALPVNVFDRIHLDDVREAERQLQTLVAGAAEVGPFTVRVRSVDGALRYLECVAVNLLDEPEVAGIVLTARDTTEREQLTRELEHQSLHDVLTGLGNRRLFQETLQLALDRSRTELHRVCLCFIDLDGFKLVNDVQGHAAGDALLAGVAQAISSSIRSCDMAARMGGDEFVVVLEDISDAAQACEIVERVRSAVLAVRHDAGGVEASFGLAVSRSDDTPSSLLSRADAALYRAKGHQDGRIDADELAGAFV